VGHPSVGTAWLLRATGTPVEVLRPPAGDVPVRYDGDLTWIHARPEWLPGTVQIVDLGSAAEVAAHPGQAMGEPWLYIWAWEDELAGRLRSRSSRRLTGSSRTRRKARRLWSWAPGSAGR
jgi:hypothetical protein